MCITNKVLEIGIKEMTTKTKLELLKENLFLKLEVDELKAKNKSLHKTIKALKGDEEKNIFWYYDTNLKKSIYKKK